MGRDKTKRPWAGLALLCAFSAPTARASFDLPGSFSFEFVRDDNRYYSSFEDVPAGEKLSTDAYFNSAASSFGESGVLVWAGFRLPGTESRYGILLLDLDLTRAPFDGQTPLPADAVRVKYLEKWSDRVLFEGRTVLAEVWLVDVFFSHDDEGSLELDVALLVAGGAPEFPGSRALLQGRLVSDPSPQQVRQQHGLPPHGGDDEVYVEAGCNGDIYLPDDTGQGCDCGGEDPDSGGCEGDTGPDSGCEGDDESGSGCEGDTSSSSSCEGDTGGGCSDASGSSSCSGSSSSDCSTVGRAKRPRHFRYLPQTLAVCLVVCLRRRRCE